MNYSISIITILSGVLWLFIAGAYYQKNSPVDLYDIIAVLCLLTIGIITIIGGIKLWP